MVLLLLKMIWFDLIQIIPKYWSQQKKRQQEQVENNLTDKFFFLSQNCFTELFSLLDYTQYYTPRNMQQIHCGRCPCFFNDTLHTSSLNFSIVKNHNKLQIATRLVMPYKNDANSLLHPRKR